MKKLHDNSLFVKLDMNFLEYPLWILNSRSSKEKIEIVNNKGKYVLSQSKNIIGLPSKTDVLVLYYLLGQLNKSNFESNRISISRYKLSCGAWGTHSKKYYERLRLCLDKLADIHVQFKKTFYSKAKSLESRGFHIIKNWKFDARIKKLQIFFDEDFVEVLKSSTFYTLFKFNEYKRLSLSVSCRLFEILLKRFGNKPWRIGIKKLGKKLTMSKTSPSEILPVAKTALKEINKETHLQFELDYNEPNKMCTFKKIFKPNKELDELKSKLPNAYKEQPSILGLLSKWVKREGFDYVMGNLIYAKDKYKANFKNFLIGALENNWGEKKVEACETAHKANDAIEKQMYDKSWGIYNSLSDLEKENVDKEIEEDEDCIYSFYSDKATQLYYYFERNYHRFSK